MSVKDRDKEIALLKEKADVILEKAIEEETAVLKAKEAVPDDEFTENIQEFFDLREECCSLLVSRSQYLIKKSELIKFEKMLDLASTTYYNHRQRFYDKIKTELTKDERRIIENA